MHTTLATHSAEIYLVRHGETILSPRKNFTGQYIGSTDVPLSEHGKQQARLLAEKLESIHFDACYCSILGRCQETARILAVPHQLEIIPIPDLREIDYGAWERLTSNEMQTRYSKLYRTWHDDPANIRAPGGESGEDVLRRVRPVMEQLASSHLGQRILVVAHRTVNRIWLCHILGYRISSYRQSVGQDLTALNILEYAPGEDASLEATTENAYRFSVNVLNDTSHLLPTP